MTIKNCICPHCKEEIEIEIEVESMTEYFYEDSCPNCNKKIVEIQNECGKLVKLDMLVYEEVADYYVGQADYYGDR